MENGQDVLQDWLAAAKESGRKISSPGELESQSREWVFSEYQNQNTIDWLNMLAESLGRTVKKKEKIA
ncbi:hypothetical protein [Candidatus Coxiella mudrowiae]|uniref:hypothetical protein n=1 Tax=Candidatus Coxiella mudrowiae TaxID=2054173 RepID=UPI003CC838D7